MLTTHGLISESYQPGAQTLLDFDPDTQHEILSLFPRLGHDPNAYGPTVRPALRTQEVAPLLRAIAA